MLVSVSSRRALWVAAAARALAARGAAPAAAAAAAASRTTPAAYHATHQASLQQRRSIFDGMTNPGGSGVPAKKEEGETAPAKPIDFDVAARVEGQETQIVVVSMYMCGGVVACSVVDRSNEVSPAAFILPLKHKRWTWNPTKCSARTRARCST